MCDYEDKTLEFVVAQGVKEYTAQLLRMAQELGEPGMTARIRTRIRQITRLPDPVLADRMDTDLAALPGDPGVWRRYFVAFEEDRVKMATAKGTALKTEYGQLVRAKAFAETDRERHELNAGLRSLEAELARWEGETVSYEDRLAEARQRVADYRQRLADAERQLADGDNLRKAELVRRLFSKVVLHFRAVPKAKIVDCVLEPEKTQFIGNVPDCSGS